MTDIKEFLSEIRTSTESPSKSRRLRLFQQYRSADNRFGWSSYPEFGVKPRFESPETQSELLIFDERTEPLLRLAPALSRASDERPEHYCVIVVPEANEAIGSLVEGVSDVVSIPNSGSSERLLSFLEDRLEKQSFERIVGLSHRPGWVWLGDVLGDLVDHKRYEGITLQGLKPSVRGGPGVIAYFNSMLSREDGGPLPIRHGPFEGLLVGDVDHDPVVGLAPSEGSIQSATDFREGLHRPNQPLSILVPPRDGSDSEAIRWSQLADHMVSEVEREVVIFGDYAEYDFHERIDDQLTESVTFVDRWLPSNKRKAALMNLAEGIVTGRLEESLMGRRLDRPVVEIGPPGTRDTLSLGDVRVGNDPSWPDPVQLGEIYQSVVNGERRPELYRELPGGVDVENDGETPALIRSVQQFPPTERSVDEVRKLIHELFRYQTVFIVNHFVGLELVDMTKKHVERRFKRRFGDRPPEGDEEELIDGIRDRLRSLERALSTKVKGLDPAPPEELSGAEMTWFRVIEPLWQFRGVANGEEKTNKIVWGFRYFFNGCRRILKFAEEC